MTGPWDAGIGLLYAAEARKAAPIRLLARGTPFVVVAVVEVGENVMEVVDDYELFLFVRNRSRSSTLLNVREARFPDPQTGPLVDTVHIRFDGDWVAQEGDVLDVCATLKVTAGVNTRYAQAEGSAFIVV